MSALTRYLAFAVLGRKAPRKSPRKSRKGPPRSCKYRAWVRSLPSAVSGLEGCEAAHTGSDGGMSQKSSDFSCVPLTPAEHRELHQGGRRTFEAKYGVSLARVARSLNRTWLRETGRAIKGGLGGLILLAIFLIIGIVLDSQ